jgi:hypothetical protein
MSAPKVWTGACHCGAVRFTVTLVDDLDKPRRCNCSLCRMRGAVVASARVEDLNRERSGRSTALPLQHDAGRALLLLEVRNLYASQTPLESQPTRRQRRLPFRS